MSAFMDTPTDVDFAKGQVGFISFVVRAIATEAPFLCPLPPYSSPDPVSSCLAGVPNLELIHRLVPGTPTAPGTARCEQGVLACRWQHNS